MKQKEKLRTAAEIKTQDYKNWAQFQPLHWTQLQNCSAERDRNGNSALLIDKKSLRV